MKWTSHHLIADRLYQELVHPQFQKYHETLREGSIYPDKQNNRLPHHYGCEENIEDLLRKARNLRLTGQHEKAIFWLGVALHYIQDKWTAVDGSHPMHDDYEELLTKCEILPREANLSAFFPVLSTGAFEDHEWLQSNINKSPPYHEHIIHVLQKPKPLESNAILDLNTAYRLSYRTTEIVLQPIKNRDAENLITELASKTRKKVDVKDTAERKKLTLLRKRCERLRTETGILNFVRRIYSKLQLGRKEKAYKKKEHLNEIIIHYKNQYNEIHSRYREWYLVSPLPNLQTLGSIPQKPPSQEKNQQKKLLSKKIRENYPNAYRTWTEREDKKLINEYNNGMKIKVIAKIHGRKRGAISSRLRKLGLIH